MNSIVRFVRPIFLLFVLLAWLLGAGIADYLGLDISWPVFVLGLVFGMTMLPAAIWLAEAFRLPLMPLEADETPRQRIRLRAVLLFASYAALSLAFGCVLILLVTGQLNLSTGLLMGMAFLFVAIYAVPPFRLCDAGYGEFLLASYFSVLLPVLSFLLQADRFHRLLSTATFPVLLLALAWLLIENFPTFARDQKLGRQTLLTRLTWQRAIPLHHFLVGAAFLLFGLAPMAGVPWGLIWPVFLVLPLAAVQVFWLHRIGQGGRTMWKFLLPLAAGTFGLPLYLLTLTFWLR
jgi:hypothetical protein